MLSETGSCSGLPHGASPCLRIHEVMWHLELCPPPPPGRPVTVNPYNQLDSPTSPAYYSIANFSKLPVSISSAPAIS